MATELKLGSIKLGKDTWSIGMSSIQGGTSFPSVTVAADTAKTQPLGNYGTLYLDAEGVLTLKGGSALTGEVKITENDATSVSLSAVSFGAAVSVAFDGNTANKALKTVVGSSSADSISVSNYSDTDFVLSAGAGNDTVVVNAITGKVDAGAGNDLVSVTGAIGEVVLGLGKDTIKFGATGATVAVSDYTFADDVIELADAVLTNDGKVKSADGTSVVSGLTAANNYFLARTTDGSKTTVLATAEENTAKVAINASSIKENEVVIIDAKSADSANITLGKASVVAVSLNTAKDAGVDTIVIGDTKAKASVNVTSFYTDDVLNFTGLDFANTSIGTVTGSKVTLGSGKMSLNLGTGVTVAGGEADDVIAKFNLNGKTLYATTGADQYIDLTEETTLDNVNVKGDLGASVKSGIVTSAQLVDLGAVNINNIDMVSLTSSAAAGTSLIGTTNKDNAITLDASAASDGVAVWAHNTENKATTDIIKLNDNNEVADTLWFGTTDGHDSVSGFQLASDILYLQDASTALTAVTGVITYGKASLDVAVAAAAADTEEIMKVQGVALPQDYYVAGDFVSVGASKDGIYLGKNAGKVNYYAVGKDASVSVTAADDALEYTFLQNFDYVGVANRTNIAAKGSVASINAAGITDEKSKVIIAGVANVTLGAGTNEVYVNGVAKDANVVLTDGSGTDKVWFSAADKNVTVDHFNTDTDVVALMGSIDGFSAKMNDDTDVVITNGSNKALTLTGVKNGVSLEDANKAKYKLFVNDAEYTTNNDGTNIYMKGTLTASSEVNVDTNIIADGGVNRWAALGVASAAIVGKDVKVIDMSSSTANFALIGSANASNTITGGMGLNHLNGGGASKDVLNGNTGAEDHFWYGQEDGSDTLKNVGLEDTVEMYDIVSSGFEAIKVGADQTVFTLKNNNKLTIDGSIDGLTFKLADGTFKYDASIEKAEDRWVKQ